MRKIQRTPFNTARGSAQGLPRPSGRRRGRKIGSRTAHCLSVRSMPKVRLARANRNIWPGIYEMGSSQLEMSLRLITDWCRFSIASYSLGPRFHSADICPLLLRPS